MRNVHADENSRFWDARREDEVAIANHLQSLGMSRTAALIAAAEHVAAMSREGRAVGGIVSIQKRVGDNGGPPINDEEI